ncbi:MAG TPA: hypothetical protein VE222_00695 [Nitrospiraceae bacterium]|nr:hypothetical protein [Nitrospiraceae bacterium]
MHWFILVLLFLYPTYTKDDARTHAEWLRDNTTITVDYMRDICLGQSGCLEGK